MKLTLTELCAYLKNYFIRSMDDIHYGEYVITGGVLTNAPELLNGQYYRIAGSVLNDGVHKFGDAEDTLNDETFKGAIWSMSIPPDVIDLTAEINDWIEANKEVLSSPYQSESFGGYSYSKASGSSGGSSSKVFTWYDQFAIRLNPYRRLFLP